MKGRIETETRASYERTLKFIANTFTLMSCNEAVDQETKMIKLPLAKHYWTRFLGEVSKEKPDKSVRAVTTITGYINAIKHAHTEANMYFKRN